MPGWTGCARSSFTRPWSRRPHRHCGAVRRGRVPRRGRRGLRRQVDEFRRWLRGRGRRAPRASSSGFPSSGWPSTGADAVRPVHRGVTQRSEPTPASGWRGWTCSPPTRWVARRYLPAPPVICYLARGPGAAIRRARPGYRAGRNPVASSGFPANGWSATGSPRRWSTRWATRAPRCWAWWSRCAPTWARRAPSAGEPPVAAAGGGGSPRSSPTLVGRASWGSARPSG